MKTLVVLVVLVGVSACAPLDGYPCETLDEQRCDGPKSVAFCESTSLGGKKWKAYDCPSGCSAGKCSNWKGVVEGEPCPPRVAGSWCDADGHAISCVSATSTDGGVPSGRWTGLPCPNCRKDVPIEETAPCSNGVCSCQ